MDMTTGQLKWIEDGMPMPENCIPVAEAEITPKQREDAQVSIHDTRSPLGKKWSSIRHQRRALRKGR